MKYFIILLIANFVFFGCAANDAGTTDPGNTGGTTDPGNTGGTTDPGNTGGTTDPGNTGGTTDPGNTGGTTDPGNTGGTFEEPELCEGPWGEPENGTSIEVEGETYNSIIDQAGLEDIKNDMAARYILCDDFAITGTSPFTSLGSPSFSTSTILNFGGDKFTGILEGNGKTISNLKIQTQAPTAGENSFVGLFAVIGTDGVVKNLNLSLAGGANDPSLEGLLWVGALAGINEGTITNVGVTGGHVKGVNGSQDIGGLVGINYGTITASYVTSSVEGPSTSRIGGLVGLNTIMQNHATGGNITTSHATGDITTTGTVSSSIGGLVGENLNGTITESYATGSVRGLSDNRSNDIGGLVGYTVNGTITASYATGDITVEGNVAQTTVSSNIGGLVGKKNEGNTYETYATGDIRVESTDTSNIGGLVGYLHAAGIERSYTTGDITVEGTYASNIGGLVGGTSRGTITASYATGSVEGLSVTRNENIGGLVGENNGGVINASYATGLVTTGPTSSHIGGLIGVAADHVDPNPAFFILSRINACYFDKELTGQQDSIGHNNSSNIPVGQVTAYSTSISDGKVYTLDSSSGDLMALIVEADFVDNNTTDYWNFDTIWAWQGDGQWPILQFQTTMTTQ